MLGRHNVTFQRLKPAAQLRQSGASIARHCNCLLCNFCLDDVEQLACMAQELGDLVRAGAALLQIASLFERRA